MRRILIGVAALAALAMVGVLVWGSVSSPVEAGKNGPAGKSNMAHLYLYEKDHTDTEWPIVEGGAWGKMKYNLEGETFDFVFNGHGLEAGEDYTLIYYKDPWPTHRAVCLGFDTANKGGNVHIMGSDFSESLPVIGDINAGAKIWLVLEDDVKCGTEKMVDWNPVEYLFENDLITFTAL